MDKRATGWVPDYPDIKDYTLESKQIKKILNEVQGVQVAGSLDSQKDNIIELLKRFPNAQEVQIKSLIDRIEQGMANEVRLMQAQLKSEDSTDFEQIVGEYFEIDRIPTSVFNIIVKQLLPETGALIVSEQPIYQRLTKVIYPITKVIAKMIAPIGGHANLEKAVNEAIQCFDNLIQSSEELVGIDRDFETQIKSLVECFQSNPDNQENAIKALIKLLSPAQIAQQSKDGSNNQASSNLQITPSEHTRHDPDNDHFKRLALTAVLEARQLLDEVYILPFKQAKVLQFGNANAANAYLEIKNFQWAADSPVTVEFWAKINCAHKPNSSVIFSVGEEEMVFKNYPILTGFSAELRANELVWYYTDTSDRYSSFYPARLGYQIKSNPDQWVHIALVSEGARGQFMGIYINGELVEKIASSSSPNHPLKSLVIGKSPVPHNLEFEWDGELSDFRIWKRVCTPEEIRNNRFIRLSGNEAGLVGYWPMDEGSGQDVFDRSPSKINGTLFYGRGNAGESSDHKASLWTSSDDLTKAIREGYKTLYAQFEQELNKLYFNKVLKTELLNLETVIQFQGNNRPLYYTDFTWPRNSSVTLDSPITIDFWIKVNESDLRYSYILTIDNKELRLDNWDLEDKPISREQLLSVSLSWDDRCLRWFYGLMSVKANFSPYLNQWTHVALVSGGKKGNFSGIYLNGELKAFSNQTITNFSAKGICIGSYTSNFDNNAVYDSQVWEEQIFTNFFRGEIANFRISSKSLSPEEITASMFEGNSPVKQNNDLTFWLTTSDTTQSETRSRNLSAYYHNGTDAPRLIDEVFLKNTVSTIEKNNKALHFKGGDSSNNGQYAVLPPVESLGLRESSFTIECSIQIEQFPTGSATNNWSYQGTPIDIAGYEGDVWLFCNDTKQEINQRLLHLTIRDKKPYMGFFYNDTAGTSVLNSKEWYHLTWCYDHIRKSQKIYVNGKDEHKREDEHKSKAEFLRNVPGAEGKQPSQEVVEKKYPFSGKGNLWVGRGLWGYQKYFVGFIKEVRIWNTVLTDDEIKSRSQRALSIDEINQSNLVAYWPFDEIQGFEVINQKGRRTNPESNPSHKNRSPQLITPDSESRKKWFYKEPLKARNLPQRTTLVFTDSEMTSDKTEGKYLYFPVLEKFRANITTKNSQNSTDGQRVVGLTILPDLVDLTFWCSPVEDQGSLNSCTAQAGIALVEYFQKKSFGKFINASRLFLYTVTRNLMKVEKNAGTSIRNTMQALSLFGVPPEEYWPYIEENANKDPDSFCFSFAQNYQTLKYFRLDQTIVKHDVLLAQIKAILFSGFPCIFGFTLYRSIYNASNPSGYIPFPHRKDVAEGGHAVVAVGYDDNKVITNLDGESSTGALLIRNSWGANWGEGGYGWMPYDYVLKGLTADWWSLISAEWFDTGQFGLGGDDWTDNLGGCSQGNCRR